MNQLQIRVMCRHDDEWAADNDFLALQAKRSAFLIPWYFLKPASGNIQKVSPAG
jgi:hypothetical protein